MATPGERRSAEGEQTAVLIAGVYFKSQQLRRVKPSSQLLLAKAPGPQTLP